VLTDLPRTESRESLGSHVGVGHPIIACLSVLGHWDAVMGVCQRSEGWCQELTAGDVELR